MIKEPLDEQAIVEYATIANQNKLSECTEKIVPRKTVVYETLVDPTVIKVSGERVKCQLFTKFGILRPSSSVIELESMEKYYEPFVVVNAKYFLDYYRMNSYHISIDNEVKEVILLGRKFYPKKENSIAIIKLEGEERLVVENKAFLMLDKNGQDVNLEMLPSAPSEKNPEEAIAKYGIKEIAPEADVGFIRKRLVHRPENLSRIVTEVFEIGERVVIYTPRFKLNYVNAFNYEKRSIEFDGVTSKRIRNEKLHFRPIQAIKSALKSVFKK